MLIRSLNERHHGAAIRALLLACELPVADLNDEHSKRFIGCLSNASSDATLLGVVGLQALGDVALLRSLAVAPPARGQGYACALVAAVEDDAKSQSIERLYLLTMTVPALFEHLGYSVIERNSVPPAIARSAEFASLCPDTAICMSKDLTLA